MALEIDLCSEHDCLLWCSIFEAGLMALIDEDSETWLFPDPNRNPYVSAKSDIIDRAIRLSTQELLASKNGCPLCLFSNPETVGDIIGGVLKIERAWAHALPETEIVLNLIPFIRDLNVRIRRRGNTYFFTGDTGTGKVVAEIIQAHVDVGRVFLGNMRFATKRVIETPSEIADGVELFLKAYRLRRRSE